MKFFSHINPDNSLFCHLSLVADMSAEIIAETPVSPRDREFLITLSRLIGIGHDYGKYTSYFQNHLMGKKRSGRLHEHSFISAFFTAHLIHLWTKARHGLPDWASYAPLIGYFVVMHHHGSLRMIKDDIISYFEYEDGFIYDLRLSERLEIMKAQITDQLSYINVIREDYHDLLLHSGLTTIEISPEISDFLENWESALQMLDDLYFGKYHYERHEELKHRIYQYTLLLYSALIDSDKLAAAGVKRSPRLHVPEDLVDRFRKTSFDIHATKGINGWRNRMYDTVMNRLKALGEEIHTRHLYTLTAPTGAGKTLLSFSVALKWRAQIKQRRGLAPRIIYSLPFTSVIDQNEQVFRKVLELLPDFKSQMHNYLLKHHHLSDVRYRRDDREQSLRDSLMLMESWEAEIIVTTFIQLFHTIIGNQNRLLKKFHKIAGSIIILDEVQNLPIEYWPLIRRTLKALADTFQCKILLLTATQPFIFEKGEAVELLEGRGIEPSLFFTEQNRVELELIKPEERGYTPEEWVSRFQETFQSGLNYMAVFNTIATSIYVYKQVKKWVRRKKVPYHVVYLSTNIIPRERKRRIQRINRLLKDGAFLILISTQVVEAGVDLDFDVVFRDLGPVDSIIQAAGRCNRHGDIKNLGKVWVTPVVRGDILESNLVYRKLHTLVAQEVMPDTPILEAQFHQLVDTYFAEVLERKNLDDSDAIWRAMNTLNFDSETKSESEFTVSDFKLIEEKGHYLDVFVEVDEKGEKIWELYQKYVVAEEDIERRYTCYLRLKRLVQLYVVSAPARLVKGLLDEDRIRKSKMLYLPNYLLDQYYDAETGFLQSAEEADAWIM